MMNLGAREMCRSAHFTVAKEDVILKQQASVKKTVVQNGTVPNKI
jgi:hypothetical protein